MRMPRYLSPTGLKLFYHDRNAYYIQYLCETRTARAPQTQPMAAGSAFDAYVKSFLVERLLGTCPPEFEKETILRAQVEPHNLDWAREHGQIIFNAYHKQGALADILLDLQGAVGRPRFEASIEAPVGNRSISHLDVPLMGKPDIYFIHKQGARIIFDWKVNGYCSNYNVSPKPGYVRLRSTGKDNGQQHPAATCLSVNGIKISVNHPLDSVEVDWAAQLSIYAWLLGEEIGSNFIVAIDQIACSNDGLFNKVLRVAQHRSLVTEAFQRKVFDALAKAWEIIQSGHIFDNLSRAESDLQCERLDSMATATPDPDFDLLCR